VHLRPTVWPSCLPLPFCKLCDITLPCLSSSAEVGSHVPNGATCITFPLGSSEIPLVCLRSEAACARYVGEQCGGYSGARWTLWSSLATANDGLPYGTPRAAIFLHWFAAVFARFHQDCLSDAHGTTNTCDEGPPSHVRRR